MNQSLYMWFEAKKYRENDLRYFEAKLSRAVNGGSGIVANHQPSKNKIIIKAEFEMWRAVGAKV